MTSHVAYVIYATITLITTQGLCKTYIFSSCLSLLCIRDRTFSYVPYLSFPFSHIHVVLLTLYRIRNQVYLSTRNRSRLNATRLAGLRLGAKLTDRM